jgi:hypothetical protein
VATLLLLYAGSVVLMGLAEGPPDMVVLPRIILLLMLGSLVGFCCYAWLAWNNFSTIRKLKKGLEVEIYESTWISKIIKTVAYVWIVAVTLLMFIYSVSLLVAITNVIAVAHTQAIIFTIIAAHFGIIHRVFSL